MDDHDRLPSLRPEFFLERLDFLTQGLEFLLTKKFLGIGKHFALFLFHMVLDALLKRFNLGAYSASSSGSVSSNAVSSIFISLCSS